MSSLDRDSVGGGLRVRRDGQDLGRAVQARFLEQGAAPADARDDVAVDGGDVRGERLVEAGGDVREQLVAAVGACRDDRVGGLGRRSLPTRRTAA